MNIWCLLGCHDFEQIAPDKPLRSEGVYGKYFGWYALHRCRRCRKESLREDYQSHQWYQADEMTEVEYMESIKE